MKQKYKNNSVRGPLNAWIFKILDGYMNYLFGKEKAKLFKDHPNTIVEIGSGSGANMRYLREGTKLIAIEPNIHMHANLRKRAKTYGIELEVKALVGESIDLPSDSYEFVVSTLVLCTVKDPVLCVDQIKRILKPDGVFVFLEHVKSRNNSWLTWLQNIIHKPWHWFFEGCHTNRDTKALLASSGFSSLQVENYNSYSPFIPIIPQIRGRAIK